MADGSGKVYLVVDEQSGIFGAHVEDEARATMRARAIEGVVVALPIVADFRRGRQPSSATHQPERGWTDGLCDACGRPVRQWRPGGAIIDPDPTDEGDVAIVNGEPKGENVVGRMPLYRSHFFTCPKHLVVDRG